MAYHHPLFGEATQHCVATHGTYRAPQWYGGHCSIGGAPPPPSSLLSQAINLTDMTDMSAIHATRGPAAGECASADRDRAAVERRAGFQQASSVGSSRPAGSRQQAAAQPGRGFQVPVRFQQPAASQPGPAEAEAGGGSAADGC
eukprot:COSAG01_NODE_4567_length_4918_cov_3.696203_5_plen_144_part_00